MSHTTTVKVQIKDMNILEKALQELNIPYQKGTFQLYSSSHSGIAVKLEGWRYPVIFSKGEIYYDNYGGNWGNKAKLEELINKVIPTYTKILTIEELAKMGFRIEQIEKQGDKIVITAQEQEVYL